jgi:hypothetical protein
VLFANCSSGIVGAETILSIYRDKPIPAHSTTIASEDPESASTGSLPLPSTTWPSVIGLLAFDTPYLGISPGVLAHNAESHIQTVRGAWNTYSTVTSAFGLGGAAAGDESKPVPKQPTVPTSNDPDPSAQPAWQRWGKYAMYAGAAGAILAGGAAAYANRAQISEGWGWASGHLEFVGCLARKAQLEARVKELVRLAGDSPESKDGEKVHLGWANLYSQLGAEAGTLKWNDDGSSGQNSNRGWAHIVMGSDRTFCLLPAKNGPVASALQFWENTVNDKQGNEISAHMHMFTPKDNPGYYGMSERAKEKITGWVKRTWPIESSVELYSDPEDEAQQAALEDSVIVEKDDLIEL